MDYVSRETCSGLTLIEYNVSRETFKLFKTEVSYAYLKFRFEAYGDSGFVSTPNDLLRALSREHVFGLTESMK